MKKIYFLFVFILITFYGFAQGNEDFSNMNATSSYTDGSFVGNNGVIWNYVHSRNEHNFAINGKGIILRRAKEPSSISALISGGIGNFSVNTRKAFKGNSKRKLELVLNGSVVYKFEPYFETGEDSSVKQFVVNNINIPGDVTVTLRLFGSNGNQQITLDDIEWSGFAGIGTPSLSILSPIEGEEFVPNADVLLDFSTLNFNIAIAGNGNGHVKYTLDGGTANMSYTTDPINLGVLSSGSHSVVVELVDDSSSSLNPVVSKTVNFKVAPITQVANLAALRADVIANGAGNFYEVMSVPTITFTRALRSQKYAQDASAGILIDDFDGTIATEFKIGDGISGLKGQASLDDWVLHLIPIADASIAIGSTVIPEVVSIATLLTNFQDYESELVKINGVTFTNASGTFATSAIYSVSDGSAIDFRTTFGEVDYIGSAIPAATTDLIVLVSHFNGNPQITARSMGDLLSTPSLTNAKFNLYPNPTKPGLVKISSSYSSNIYVEAFDVLGKTVIKKANLQNKSLDVSRLKTGIYILKITQDEATVTKKLIID